MRIEFESKQHLNVTYNEGTHTVSGLGSIVNVPFSYNAPYKLETTVPGIAASQITYHHLMPHEDMYHFNGFIIHNRSNYPRMVMGTGGFYAHNQFIRYSITPFILAPGASAHALLVERTNYERTYDNFLTKAEYAYATKKILAQYKHFDKYKEKEYYFQGLTLQVVTTPVFKRKYFYDDFYYLDSDLGKAKESFNCGEGLLTKVHHSEASYADYAISTNAHLPVVLKSDEEIFKLPCITFGCTRDLSVSLGNDSFERSYLIVSGGVTHEAVRYLGFPCCTMDGISDCTDEGLYSNEDLLVLCIEDSSYAVVGANGVSYITVSNNEKIPDAVWQSSIIVAIPLLEHKNEILDSMSVVGNSYRKVDKTYAKYVSRKELTKEVQGDDSTLFTAGESSFSINYGDFEFYFDGDLRSISVAERNWLAPTKKNANKWIIVCNCSSHLKLVYIFVATRAKANSETYFMHPIVVGPHTSIRVHMAEPGYHSGYLYYRVWAVAMPLLMPVGVEPDELNDKISTMRGASSFMNFRLHRILSSDGYCACDNTGYIPVFYENDCTVFSRWSRFYYQTTLYSGDFAHFGEVSQYAVLPWDIKNVDFHQAFGFFVAPFSDTLGANYNRYLNNYKKFTNVALKITTEDVGGHNRFSLTEGGYGRVTGISGDYLNRNKNHGVSSKMSVKLPIEHIVDPKTGNRSIFIVDSIDWDSSVQEETL